MKPLYATQPSSWSRFMFSTHEGVRPPQNAKSTSAFLSATSSFNENPFSSVTGGTLNGLFLREKLFDFVDIVVAPVLIGGKDTSTLIDGKSLFSQSELSKLGVLKLQECVILENSYLRLRYEVIR